MSRSLAWKPMLAWSALSLVAMLLSGAWSLIAYVLGFCVLFGSAASIVRGVILKKPV